MKQSSFISSGRRIPVADGQRDYLSLPLSPVGYNVLSIIFITCLCLNVFFDETCKFLRIKCFQSSASDNKARNRINKGRNRIALKGRFGEFYNQMGVLELSDGVLLPDEAGIRSGTSFPLSIFTCLNSYVLSYIYITCLCYNSFCLSFFNFLIDRDIQRSFNLKRGVIECKGGEIELAC